MSEVYFFIPLLAGTTSNLVYSGIFNFRKFTKSNVVLALFFGFVLITSIIAADYVLSNLFPETTRSLNFLNKDLTSLITTLPISVVYSIVGPFPWTQFLLKVYGWEFHFPQYLTSVFNICLYLGFLFFVLNRKQKPSRLQFVIIIFFLK